jgi:hypothetical protein
MKYLVITIALLAAACSKEVKAPTSPRGSVANMSTYDKATGGLPNSNTVISASDAIVVADTLKHIAAGLNIYLDSIDTKLSAVTRLSDTTVTGTWYAKTTFGDTVTIRFSFNKRTDEVTGEFR